MVALGIATSSLRANPLRSVLATLGVIIGVAALVAVFSLGDGMERYARTRIESQGYNSVTLQPVETDELDGVAIRRDHVIELTPRDALDLAKVLPPGTTVQLRSVAVTTIALAGDTTLRGARVVALFDPSLDHALKLVSGRYFAAADTARTVKEILLSDTLASQLVKASPATAIGKAVRFGTGAEATVAGIVTAKEGRTGNVVLAPAAAAGAIVMQGPAAQPPTMIDANAKSIEDVDSVRAAVARWVTQRYPRDTADVRITSLTKSRLEELERGVLLFKLFMGAIVGISLLVGGIGIMNVLLASVTERTREIGIRKAAGATDGAVLQQFLAESVAITSAGAVLGMMLGLVASFGFAAIMRSVTKAEVYAGFDVGSLLTAALVAIFVGLVFGTYPALRAARLSPIDAIRHE